MKELFAGRTARLDDIVAYRSKESADDPAWELTPYRPMAPGLIVEALGVLPLASPPLPGRGEPEAVTQELVTDLVRECERAMKQRDEALADPTKRGPDGRTHDTTFEHILRQHLDPTYSYYLAASRPKEDTHAE